MLLKLYKQETLQVELPPFFHQFFYDVHRFFAQNSTFFSVFSPFTPFFLPAPTILPCTCGKVTEKRLTTQLCTARELFYKNPAVFSRFVSTFTPFFHRKSHRFFRYFVEAHRFFHDFRSFSKKTLYFRKKRIYNEYVT